MHAVMPAEVHTLSVDDENAVFLDPDFRVTALQITGGRPMSCSTTPVQQPAAASIKAPVQMLAIRLGKQRLFGNKY